MPHRISVRLPFDISFYVTVQVRTSVSVHFNILSILISVQLSTSVAPQGRPTLPSNSTLSQQNRRAFNTELAYL